jgi:hypothetical protein
MLRLRLAVSYDSWDDIADVRVERALARGRVMTQHMLESKISEAGPQAGLHSSPSRRNQRVQPHRIGQSIVRQFERGNLRPIAREVARERGLVQGDLLAHASFSIDRPSQADEARLDRVIQGYAAYHPQARDKRCGRILEDLVQRALLQCNNVTVIGEPGREVNIPVNGVDLQITGPADHVVGIGSELVLVEDKNRRPWLYPSSEEVWQTLRRALRADCALPVLIARKISPAVLKFFKLIGALGFQTNNQIFARELAPAVNEQFGLVVSKEGLNFHDIRFAESTQARGLEARITRYFDNTVARDVAERRARFRDAADALEEVLAAADDNPTKVTGGMVARCRAQLAPDDEDDQQSADADDEADRRGLLDDDFDRY